MQNRLVITAVFLLAAGPARAALVLEYVRVSSITAGPAAGPALSGPLVMDATGVAGPATVFLQIALRDTLGVGPNAGYPHGTVAWQTNNGNAGAGSLGLGAFFIRFDSVPGVAVNPAPTSPTNARLVDGMAYASVSPGSSPPTFTRFGGLLNFGFAPGHVPDPVTGRIGLFNIRVNALANGSGTFQLRDPNPTFSSVDNAVLENAEYCISCGSGHLTSIDDLLFGPNFTNTYGLNVVVIPEPTALALAGAAALAVAARKRFCKGEQRA